MSGEVQEKRYTSILELLKKKSGKILDIGCQNRALYLLSIHYGFHELRIITNVLEKRGFGVAIIKNIGRFWHISNNMPFLSKKIENKLAYSQYH